MKLIVYCYIIVGYVGAIIVVGRGIVEYKVVR